MAGKLIETRGEEPTFLPGHMAESWQRVDFGLGASSMHSSPEVQASLPPRQRHYARMVLCGLLGAGAALAALTVVRMVFLWART